MLLSFVLDTKNIVNSYYNNDGDHFVCVNFFRVFTEHKKYTRVLQNCIFSIFEKSSLDNADAIQL